MWSALQAHLSPGTTVNNWTVANGLLGDTFTVTAVGPGHVEVDTPGEEYSEGAQRGFRDRV